MPLKFNTVRLFLQGSINYFTPLDLRSMTSMFLLKERLIELMLFFHMHRKVKFERRLRFIDVRLLPLRLRKLSFLLLLRSMLEMLFPSRSSTVSSERRVWAVNSYSLVHLLIRVVASWNLASFLYSWLIIFCSCSLKWFFF